MVGQMSVDIYQGFQHCQLIENRQGKFQLEVMRDVGHYLHEVGVFSSTSYSPCPRPPLRGLHLPKGRLRCHSPSSRPAKTSRSAGGADQL